MKKSSPQAIAIEKLKGQSPPKITQKSLDPECADI